VLAPEHVLELLVGKSWCQSVHPLGKTYEHITSLLASIDEVCIAKACEYLMDVI